MMTLQNDKTMLFLRSVDPELQEKLELLLEDKEMDEALKTNWKDVEDVIKVIAKREGRREKISVKRSVEEESSSSNHVESSDLWSSALSLVKQWKTSWKVLLRTASTIRKTMAWDDPMETLSGIYTDGRVYYQPTTKEKATSKEKYKGLAYNLLSDIEAIIDLKEVLEERILNAKIKFFLREILGITKKEFHDVIIDVIKQKRQLAE
ncbi:hypothetical protein R1flu_019445 [Riccia fluitans]|uniref:Uncharacterized protein n=1 Tax=Riccia fluitans TaxID=41844 RepID=A0ABD1ZIN3_9MARC